MCPLILIDVVYREGTQDDAMRLIDIAKQNLSSFKLIVRDVDMEYSIYSKQIFFPSSSNSSTVSRSDQ
jgi:hypothetical protein